MKFLPSIKKQMQKKFSEGEVAAQLHRVQNWSRSMNSLCLQIRGNKIRNHDLNLTPLIAHEMSDKEGGSC